MFTVCVHLIGFMGSGLIEHLAFTDGNIHVLAQVIAFKF